MDVKAVKVFFSNEQKEQISKNVRKILDSGQLAAGEFVENFEKKWSSINNVKYGIAVSSGGAALEVIFKSLNIISVYPLHFYLLRF